MGDDKCGLSCVWDLLPDQDETTQLPRYMISVIRKKKKPFDNIAPLALKLDVLKVVRDYNGFEVLQHYH